MTERTRVKEHDKLEELIILHDKNLFISMASQTLFNRNVVTGKMRGYFNT